ncbi:WGR domain-containing protein [Ferrovum sp.]|uniref:WGR domain-containing protein n=1 Tax=Ferrovum sp. TaxID=2609467 RepID=UPI002629A950|nr:WGR domain-containing protein [Ferrovum sp.]
MDDIVIIEQVDLGLSNDRSDKVYRIFLEKNNGFKVRVEYGRRGRGHQSGRPLGSDNISLRTARKVFDKLLSVKLHKGYSVEDRYTRPGWVRDAVQPEEVQEPASWPVFPVRKMAGGRIVGW